MSRPIASTLVALLVLSATPATGHGQAATRNAPRDQTSALMTRGAHVRVKLRGERAWTGTVVSVADDSMLVHDKSGADTTLVRFSQLSELYVSAGARRSRHLVRNTVIGVVVGAGLGRVVGAGMVSGGCMEGDPCWNDLACLFCMAYTSTPRDPVRDQASAGTVVGGLVGGALGLLVSRKRNEDWRRVSVAPRRTAVRLSPRGATVALAF